MQAKSLHGGGRCSCSAHLMQPCCEFLSPRKAGSPSVFLRLTPVLISLVLHFIAYILHFILTKLVTQNVHNVKNFSCKLWIRKPMIHLSNVCLANLILNQSRIYRKHSWAPAAYLDTIIFMCTLSIPLGYGGLIPQGPGGSIPLD